MEKARVGAPSEKLELHEKRRTPLRLLAARVGMLASVGTLVTVIAGTGCQGSSSTLTIGSPNGGIKWTANGTTIRSPRAYLASPRNPGDPEVRVGGLYKIGEPVLGNRMINVDWGKPGITPAPGSYSCMSGPGSNNDSEYWDGKDIFAANCPGDPKVSCTVTVTSWGTTVAGSFAGTFRKTDRVPCDLEPPIYGNISGTFEFASCVSCPRCTGSCGPAEPTLCGE